jgi:tetratricopeptide (TPR) repeat protein
MRKWIRQFFSSTVKTENPPLSTAAPDTVIASQVMVDTSIEEKARGDQYLHSGDLAAAAQSYLRAIEINSNNAKAHSNLGFVRREQGQSQDAERCFNRALAIDPAIADTHYMLGGICQADGRLDAALTHFCRALDIAPDFENAYLDACNLLVQRGQLEEARQLIVDGVRKNPSYANLHFYLGNLHHELKQLDLSIACFRQALSIQPDHSQVLGNLGIVLLKQDETEAAITAFQRAVALDPNYLDAYNNMGNALLRCNRFDEAMACYEKGLAINPRSERLRYNKGLLSLLLGDFESGWQGYEYRWYQTEQTPCPIFAQPLWLNDANIEGKRIFLHAEQGIGDALQFVRYVEKVISLGAIVFLEVHPPLKSLLERLPGVAGVWSMGEVQPEFDFHCPLASLPLAFKTSLESMPANTPYLNAPIARVKHWESYFHDYPFPRIGVVWSGGTFLKNDHNRSIKLETFSKLARHGSRRFFSLQKEVRAIDAPLLEDLSNITHLGPQLSDFSETAALVSNLDLIISVDTSVAHLAGALGKPVWILLPFSPDFRWLLNRDDSPWYPTARLFRQPSIGDWDSVLHDVQRALEAQF